MTKRVINFSPGPSTLPLSALELARAELLDYADTGMSIMEHSHRGPAYSAVHEEAKSLLRELLGVPDTHQILFMQGGATAQFALVPMNLLGGGEADYVTTGVWSEKALAEARVVGSARELANTKDASGRYAHVPARGSIEATPGAPYLHLTSNNTIYGTQYHDFPATGDVPLVADMSSDLCWRPLDVSRFGLIYAGAQKNLGLAGVTLVIIRKDLLERSPDSIPRIFRYSTIAAGDSLQNTAPTFAIYMVRNVLRWIKAEGGLRAMQTRNQTKADALYGAIDAHPEFFRSLVARDSRSVMNVTFRLPSEELEKRFVAEATQQDMVGLKGHRSAGGIRVSMYNAMEPSAIERLVEFMRTFVRTHGRANNNNDNHATA